MPPKRFSSPFPLTIYHLSLYQNVYLTELIEFHPGQVGLARRGDTAHYDADGYPLQNLGALGPPEGCYPSTFSNPDATMTVLGQKKYPARKNRVFSLRF